MPLMMDDEMNMDDLFGDGGGLSLPSRPPTRELHQRVDELRASGCCQSIAWSKWGSIASIASNGTTLELRNLRCHPDDGTWALSEPTTTPNFSASLEGCPLKHLAWSPTGSDLAVIDAVGRITILSIYSSINKPALSRPCHLDPIDDLHAVVGSFWLNQAPYPPGRPTILHGPGVKEGTVYRYEASQAPVLGPCHPVQAKSALVCVTTNGLLKVLWQQNNNKWCESHTELESIVSSDDLITHAAICPDKSGTLLIAFATTSMQLRTVRALIDWGQPKVEKAPPQALPLNPTIRSKHLAGTSWVPDGPNDPMNVSRSDSSMVQLSHLELLPPTADNNGSPVPATIVAIRSSLPSLTSHYNQDVHSTIDRWEIQEPSPRAHPSFEQLSSRRNSTGVAPPPVAYMKKLESITVNKIAVAMETMNTGRVIVVAYSDSSVEYRDRRNMLETFNDNNLDRVWHLSQIGFSYTEDEPCLQVALSPSYCSVVQLRNDGKVKWKQLDYHLGDIGKSMDEPLYSAVITALSLSCATSVMRNVNYDDILATASKHVNPQFSYDWLTELSRILKVNLDYSEETHHDVLVRNTSIQLCLSIQQSLGFKGQFKQRTFSSKFAWIVLQLRNIVVLVSMAANLHISSGPNATEKSSPLEDPEVIRSLAGSVNWVLNLMAWIIDTLTNLPATLPPNVDLSSTANLSLPDLLAYLHSTNTIALHLILSSASRGFLTAILRRLAHLDYIARKAISHTSTPNPQNTPSALSPALKAAYVEIASLTASPILDIKTIETLLSSLSSSIKNAYALHNPALSGSPQAEKARNALEIKMHFGSSFPDAFKSVIVELFREDGGLLSAVKADIKPADLFFADFEILEVDEEGVMLERRKEKGMTMDCFRKAWLPNPVKGQVENGTSAAGGTAGTGTDGNASAVVSRQGARWRRCARCAAVMEDVLTQRQALQWLVMQQRRCFCSGFWDMLSPGELVA
ncbi:mediator complex subunit [Cadophora gregata]|uniref:mediator complex subunit n=1 Tax=Cadophora gregata TaxID=51156 RepID=UPI0026DD584B|nr:mediator complex subunit [Cadophora gregata]KAK0128828.1 mediator complex subunit [Cadophora gregata]